MVFAHFFFWSKYFYLFIAFFAHLCEEVIFWIIKSNYESSDQETIFCLTLDYEKEQVKADKMGQKSSQGDGEGKARADLALLVIAAGRELTERRCTRKCKQLFGEQELCGKGNGVQSFCFIYSKHWNLYKSLV